MVPTNDTRRAARTPLGARICWPHGIAARDVDGVSQQTYAKLESPDTNHQDGDACSRGKSIRLRVELGLANSDSRKIPVAR